MRSHQYCIITHRGVYDFLYAKDPRVRTSDIIFEPWVLQKKIPTFIRDVYNNKTFTLANFTNCQNLTFQSFMAHRGIIVQSIIPTKDA